MKNILLYIWQLPQNLLGLIVRVVTQSQKSDEGNYHWKYHSGLSLGSYVFVNERASLETVKHEKGHQKQNKILSYFSCIYNALQRVKLYHQKNVWYVY